jgi:hypothetical protein
MAGAAEWTGCSREKPKLESGKVGATDSRNKKIPMLGFLRESVEAKWT